MFKDRTDAGKMLADRLAENAPQNPLVLALPRGGVPVALPVARKLGAQLDLLLVRKIGLPGHPELAAGAVVNGAAHAVVFNDDILRSFGLNEADFDAAIAKKLAEIELRRKLWLGTSPPEPVAGRNVVVVDDGIATGATIRAALKALKARGAAHIMLAIPVAPADTLKKLRPLCNGIVCLEIPTPFYAVGTHYEDFRQVRDQDVVEMLRGIQDKSGDGK
ncbi:MAG: phosphoribosyltransferase [Rhodobacteraceae bacterium]|nr:phosphoribosyltransferase [Paracoccaceae bacterium]